MTYHVEKLAELTRMFQSKQAQAMTLFSDRFTANGFSFNLNRLKR